MRKTAWLTVFVATAIIAAGCGKDDKNPTSPEQETETATPQVVVVKGPNSQNVPPEVAGTISALTAVSTFAQNFVVAIQGSNPTKTGDSWVWTYTAGEASYTVLSTATSEGVSWQVKVTGAYEGKQVSNFVVLKGFSSADGKNGWWEGYDPTTSQKEIRYDWSTDSKNVVHATLQIFDNPVVKYEVVNNPDGSGSIVLYEGSVKRLEATWQADGSGSYTLYDDNGNVAGQGNWS